MSQAQLPTQEAQPEALHTLPTLEAPEPEAQIPTQEARPKAPQKIPTLETAMSQAQYPTPSSPRRLWTALRNRPTSPMLTSPHRLGAALNCPPRTTRKWTETTDEELAAR